jgi:excisionase family DNA binding protein
MEASMLRSPTEDNTDGHSGDMPPQVLLTPEEAANALRISRSRLYELVRSGTIESVRIDRLRRIPTQALREYIDRLRKS